MVEERQRGCGFDLDLQPQRRVLERLLPQAITDSRSESVQGAGGTKSPKEPDRRAFVDDQIWQASGVDPAPTRGKVAVPGGTETQCIDQYADERSGQRSTSLADGNVVSSR